MDDSCKQGLSAPESVRVRPWGRASPHQSQSESDLGAEPLRTRVTQIGPWGRASLRQSHSDRTLGQSLSAPEPVRVRPWGGASGRQGMPVTPASSLAWSLSGSCPGGKEG
eukprot:276652-Chlamydomonas_euryale.AAC.2